MKGNPPTSWATARAPFTGTDLYKLVILTAPDWSATVFIYDR